MDDADPVPHLRAFGWQPRTAGPHRCACACDGSQQDGRAVSSSCRLFCFGQHPHARVSVSLGKRVVVLPASDAAGYFMGKVVLTNQEAGQLAHDGVVSFETRSTPDSEVSYRGNAVL